MPQAKAGQHQPAATSRLRKNNCSTVPARAPIIVSSLFLSFVAKIVLGKLKVASEDQLRRLQTWECCRASSELRLESEGRVFESPWTAKKVFHHEISVKV